MHRLRPTTLRLGTTSCLRSFNLQQTPIPLTIARPTLASTSPSFSSTSSSNLLHQDAHHQFEKDPDDQLIRSIFDQPWIHRSKHSNYSHSNQSTGIFDYPELKHPSDLTQVAENTIRRCRLIVNRICTCFNPSFYSARSNQSTQNYRHYQHDPIIAFFDCIRSFDRLSDGLCRVIDLSEVIRNLHSDPNWVHAAHHAHSLLCQYMNALNTHKELYDALKVTISRLPSKVEQDPKLFSAKVVGMQFLRDFERNGIHLPSESRKKLVELSDKMLKTGRDFFSGTSSPSQSSSTYITKAEAKMISSRFSEHFEEFNERNSSRMDDQIVAHIDPMDWKSHTLLCQHPNQSVRHRIWNSRHQSSDHQIQRLESLLELRSQFAKLTGKPSWSHLVLEDKMINKPENVMKFLINLNSTIKPMAKNEIKLLEEIQSKHQRSSTHKIQPWDLDYYSNMLKSHHQDKVSKITNFSSYFSVGTCIQGLSRLFKLIYGIHFQVESIKSKVEVWDESVVKLGVIDENEGRIGTIYCDLFDRSDGSKHHGAAHYTVLCSRRTDLDDELKDVDFFHEDDIDDDSIVHRANDMNRAQFLNVPVVQRKHLPGRYQRPIVVFSCSFDPPDPVSGQPGLLNWSDVETLFHEMGHAMHSMIGQTEYHNVSGTRCATDFVELPSILMERFARSKQVLKLFARHYKDDRPLNLQQFETSILEQKKLLKGLEINNQIVMAALDQHYHSEISTGHKIDSTLEFINIKKRFSVFDDELNLPDRPDRWHGQFGHLYGYGSSYYSYLFDRVISEKLWMENFNRRHDEKTTMDQQCNPSKSSDVLNRENGERFKNSVLIWGGGKNPWNCLSELLNCPSIHSGGDHAVNQVGKWGLWD